MSEENIQNNFIEVVPDERIDHIQRQNDIESQKSHSSEKQHLMLGTISHNAVQRLNTLRSKILDQKLEIQNCQKQVQSKENKIISLQENLDNTNNELIKIKSDYNSISVQFEEKKQIFTISLNKKDEEILNYKQELDKVVDSRSELQNLIKCRENELKESNENIIHWKNLAEQAQNKNNYLNANVNSLYDEINNLKQEMMEIKSSKDREIDDLKKERDKFRDDYKVAEDKINYFSSKVKRQLGEIHELQEEKKELEGNINTLRSGKINIKNQYEEVKRQLFEEKSNSQMLESEISSYKSKTNEIEQKCLQYEKDIEILTIANKGLQQRYDNLPAESNNDNNSDIITSRSTPNETGTSVRPTSHPPVTPIGTSIPGFNTPTTATIGATDYTSNVGTTNESIIIGNLRQSLDQQNRNVIELVPKVQERREEISRILNECNNLSIQLNLRNEEVKQLNEEVQSLHTENNQLNEYLTQLTVEKQTVLDHNTSLIRTIEDLQQSGPNISIVGIHSRSSGSNFPQDVSELVEEYTRVKAEQKCYKIKIQKLEDQIKDLEHTKERLMDSIKFIKGVNIRMKSQAHLLSTELENERNLHNELSNYIKSNNLSKNLSNDDIQGISAQKLLNLEKESSKLKMDNEMITKELKNVEEKLETANKELYSYRLQKSEIEYQKKTLEDTNKLLETRLNLKETECQSYKQVSDQTSKLNKQIQALLTKADVDRTVMSAEVDKLKTELDSTKNTLSELQKDYTKGSNDLHVTKEKAESSYNEVQLLKKANEELEKKYNQTQEKLINAQAKNENLKEQLSDLSERYSNANLKWTEENQKLVDSSKQANSKVVELQTEIEELKKKVELQSNELKQSQEKLTVYEQNEQGALINKLSHDLDSANEEINVLNKGMDVLKNSLETLEIISNNTKQDYEHLKDTLEKERAEFQSRSEDFDKKDEEFQRMKNELSIINQGLTEVTIEKEQLEKTLSDLHNKSKEDETLLRLEIQKHIDMLAELQNNYNYQLQINVKDSQQLTEVRQKYSQLQLDIEKTKNEKQILDSSLRQQKENSERELTTLRNDYNLLLENNKVLKGYFDKNVDMSEDQVIPILRKENERLINQREFYLQQVEKYKAQLELLQKTADELKESLNKEREQKESIDLEQLKLQLLEKENQVKILEESNRTLRSDYDKMKTKELNLVENDRNWWRERFHVVLEKHGISDPDELEQTKEKLKKSEGEKDTLMKEKDVLMREKDALIKEKDALKVERDAIKAENSRLRIDVANFKKQITDSKKQIDDLNKEILQSKKTDQTTTKNFQTLKGQFENLKGYAQKLKTELLRLRSQETMWTTKNKKLENEISELKKAQETSLQTVEVISAAQPLEISKPETTTSNPIETPNPEVASRPIMEAPTPPAKPTETPEALTKISEDTPKPEEASKPPVKLQRYRGPLETPTTTQIKRSREEDTPQTTTTDDQGKKQKTDL
ncbi:5722_t:CDS:10 [Entrophospora sp. SA101]|nr:5722_t:CDS:10 [Entrophospora sp. SA101]